MPNNIFTNNYIYVLEGLASVGYNLRTISFVDKVSFSIELISEEGLLDGIFHLDVGNGSPENIIWDRSVARENFTDGLFSSGKTTATFNVTSPTQFCRLRYENVNSTAGLYNINFNYGKGSVLMSEIQ